MQLALTLTHAELPPVQKSECPGLVKNIATSMRAISQADSAAARASARAAANGNITTLCGATCYTNAVAAFKTVSSQSGVGCPKISYSITYLEDFMCATAGTGGDRCLVLDQDPATSGVFDGNDDLTTVTAADATKACACASAARTRFDAEAKYLAASNWALVASTSNMAVSARAQRAIGFALGAEARIRSKTVDWACSTAPSSTKPCIVAATEANAINAAGGGGGGDDDGFELFDECTWDFTCSFCGKSLMGHYLAFLKSNLDNACALEEFERVANNSTVNSELVSLCQQSPTDAQNQGANNAGPSSPGANNAGGLFGNQISVLETVLSLACGRGPNNQLCADVLFGTCDANGNVQESQTFDSLTEECSSMLSLGMYRAMGADVEELLNSAPADEAAAIRECRGCKTPLQNLANEWGCCLTGFFELMVRTLTSTLQPDGTLPADDDGASGITFRPSAHPTRDFANGINSYCGSNFPPARCRSAKQANLRARLTNVKYAWVTATQERRDQFVERFVEAIVANTGAGFNDVIVNDIRAGSVIVDYTIRATDDGETTRIADELETLLPASGGTAASAGFDWSTMNAYLASECTSTDCPCTGNNCGQGVEAEGSAATIEQAGDDDVDSAAAAWVSLAALLMAIAAAISLRL